VSSWRRGDASQARPLHHGRQEEGDARGVHQIPNGLLEDHVWFEDQWMVSSLCDE
jgi:hypothetical protein